MTFRLLQQPEQDKAMPEWSRRQMLGTGGLLAGATLCGIVGGLALRNGLWRSPKKSLVGQWKRDYKPQLAFSLRVLEDELGAGARPEPRHLTLGGINRFVGLVYDQSADEVVLLGEHVESYPEAHLDDLALSLRSAYQTGSEYGGVPGCTIDPHAGATDPWQFQDVKVFGMPSTAPMAGRVVAVDYELKKISTGAIRLKNGPQGIFDATRESISPCGNLKDLGGPVKSETVHRFWFYPLYPASPRFTRDGTAVWIDAPVSVQLLTEQEFMDQRGNRTATAEADPEARKFARSITKSLETDEIPQFIQLRNDFRILEVGKLIQFVGVTEQGLEYLLRRHVLRSVEVPSVVGGIWRQESGEIVCDHPVTVSRKAGSMLYEGRPLSYKYERRSTGGVKAEIAAPKADVRENPGALATLQKRVVESRPSLTTLNWPVYTASVRTAD
jgi:hypothetical protein